MEFSFIVFCSVDGRSFGETKVPSNVQCTCTNWHFRSWIIEECMEESGSVEAKRELFNRFSFPLYHSFPLNMSLWSMEWYLSSSIKRLMTDITIAKRRLEGRKKKNSKLIHQSFMCIGLFKLKTQRSRETLLMLKLNDSWSGMKKHEWVWRVEIMVNYFTND